MRHRLLIPLVLIFAGVSVATTAFASDLPDPFANIGIVEGFEEFANEAANSLPMNSMIGLQWSDAYIGQLLRIPPNLGMGVAFGVTTMPVSAMQTAIDAFGFIDKNIEDELGRVVGAGLPLPGGVIDARVGGYLLPFDVGLKVGTLPEISTNSFEYDYLLLGGDVRYRVFDGPLMIPTISVGAGVNHLRGALRLPGVLGDDINLANIDLPNNASDLSSTETYDISLSDPSLEFSWQTTVYELKAQASTNLLILTPYAGAGLSLASSTAGGRIASSINVSNENGDALDEEQTARLQEAYDEWRKQDPSLPAIDFTGETGIGALGTATGWGLRMYGGTSVNLLFFKIDLSAMYDLIGKNLGANIGLRFQL